MHLSGAYKMKMHVITLCSKFVQKQCYIHVNSGKNPAHTIFSPYKTTVGDGSLILPTYVVKITHPPPEVSWVSRDHELDVELNHIGFLLYHALIIT